MQKIFQCLVLWLVPFLGAGFIGLAVKHALAAYKAEHSDWKNPEHSRYGAAGHKWVRW